MTKYSLNFRNTAGSWAETSSNGAILGDAYPAVIGGLTCGWSGAVTNGDYTGATDAKLAGRNTTNSSVYFRIDLPSGPGVYRIWAAFGALSSTVSTAFLIRDGAAGATISSAPSTSVTGFGTASGSYVMDASGAVIPYATYISTSGGTYIEFTATQDHIRVERNVTGAYVINVQLESQGTPLSDVVLSNDTDTGAHSGAIQPKQPAGHGIGKITSVAGEQVFSIVSGGTYFALETRNTYTWLVTNGTRIPDGWTGAVTIRQTSVGVTRDTVINFTAATVDRPVTGALGRITTETYLKRKEVLDVVDGELWAGYTGQAFVSDQTANSYADIVSKINALTPNGTGWYRIRVQNGSWTGNGLNLTQLDFGTGGLLIEPDTGHDPVIKCEFRNFRMRKCHVRGITFVPWGTGAAQYIFTAGIPVQTSNSIMKFSENKFGAYFDAGFDISNHGNWADCLGFEFVEQINVVNNTIIGVRNFAAVTGGRIFNFRNNHFQYVRQDFHALSTAFRYSTPRGVFADDFTYVVLKDCTAWNNLDGYTGISGGATPHGDWLQIRRTTDGGYAYPTTSAGLNGSSTTPWVVNHVGFNPVANRLYKVVAVTGDKLLDVANQPTGTGTGIVSGNVTFDFLQEYNLGTTMKVLLEGNAILQDGVSINTDGNAQPNCQFVINSNSNWNNIHQVTAIDNICASANSRGIDTDTADGDIWAEYNTLVGGAQKALPNDQAMINGRNTRTRGNILGVATGGLNLTGLVSLQSEKNVAVDWKSSSVTPFLPAENLKGPMTDYGTTGWGYPITDDGTQTAAQMRSALSKTLHHLTGAAGARLTETHTITVTDSLGASVTLTLDVAP